MLREAVQRLVRRIRLARIALFTEGRIGEVLDFLLLFVTVIVVGFAVAFLLEKHNRTVGIQLLGVFAVAIGTYRTLQVNRDGQIAERFSRAITQIASDQLDSRIGGIYSLERVACDSPRDQAAVIDVLTAYARQNSKYPRGENERPGEATAMQAIAAVLRRRALWPRQNQSAARPLGHRPYELRSAQPLSV
jgi:hypothetical protein